MVEGGRLMTDFDLNIKGTTEIDSLSDIFVGVIEAVLDGTASKLHENHL